MEPDADRNEATWLHHEVARWVSACSHGQPTTSRHAGEGSQIHNYDGAQESAQVLPLFKAQSVEDHRALKDFLDDQTHGF